MDERILELRKEINKIDKRILDGLADRFKNTQEIGKIKKANNLPVVQEDRFEELKAQLKKDATTLEIDPSLVDEIWNAIHDYSVRQQRKIE